MIRSCSYSLLMPCGLDHYCHGYLLCLLPLQLYQQTWLLQLILPTANTEAADVVLQFRWTVAGSSGLPGSALKMAAGITGHNIQQADMGSCTSR
jgi:hypothetical protein